MQDISAIDKASILVEALPYIKRFHGKTVVIKYGGNAMLSEELKEGVLKDIVLMQLVGMRPVLVHGGGPDINSVMEQMRMKVEFVNGQRVTDENVMEVVEMVLTGKVNSSIVKYINQNGGSAVGLSGADANLLLAHKQRARIPTPDGGNPDLVLFPALTDALPVIHICGIVVNSFRRGVRQHQSRTAGRVYFAVMVAFHDLNIVIAAQYSRRFFYQLNQQIDP